MGPAGVTRCGHYFYSLEIRIALVYLPVTVIDGIKIPGLWGVEMHVYVAVVLGEIATQ